MPNQDNWTEREFDDMAAALYPFECVSTSPVLDFAIERIVVDFKGNQIDRKSSRDRSIRQSLRISVFERDAYRCRECGDWHGLTVDHIIPWSKGGLTKLENLQTLCRSCNSRKGNKIDE